MSIGPLVAACAGRKTCSIIGVPHLEGSTLYAVNTVTPQASIFTALRLPIFARSLALSP